MEELCSAEGMTDALLREIERVVFEAHPLSTREGALDFAELLDTRASRHRQSRSREEEALAVLSDRIGTELEKDKLVPALRTQVVEKVSSLRAMQRIVGSLSPRGARNAFCALTP